MPPKGVIPSRSSSAAALDVVHFGGDVVQTRAPLVEELLHEAVLACRLDHFELDLGAAHLADAAAKSSPGWASQLCRNLNPSSRSSFSDWVFQSGAAMLM